MQSVDFEEFVLSKSSIKELIRLSTNELDVSICASVSSSWDVREFYESKEV